MYSGEREREWEGEREGERGRERERERGRREREGGRERAICVCSVSTGRYVGIMCYTGDLESSHSSCSGAFATSNNYMPFLFRINFYFH